MSRGARLLALLLLGWAATGATAGIDDSGVAAGAIPEENAAAAEVSEPLAVGPVEWLVIGSCLVISVLAGGYTLLLYLRRRDTLSMLATLESRQYSDG